MQVADLPEHIRPLICYHRGQGSEENTAPALISALNQSPYLLEFDTQWSKGNFYLGHPPKVTHYTLTEGLSLYVDYHAIPKVDLKFKDSDKDNEALLERFMAVLNDKSFNRIPRILVNISGKGKAADFIAREKLFSQLASQNRIMLNIDLDRYRGLPKSQVYQHIRSIRHKLFSISPELFCDDLEYVKTCAHIAGLHDIHFWLHIHKHKASLPQLEELAAWGTRNHFSVYFDISPAYILENASIAW